MACAFGTPKRHPESGIYWFRKRVPDRLKAKVGKSEIKFSLRTRDPDVARLRIIASRLRININRYSTPAQRAQSCPPWSERRLTLMLCDPP